jgi:GrpB-like predicted nucleotidyltransferase (UPF0157 family)
VLAALVCGSRSVPVPRDPLERLRAVTVGEIERRDIVLVGHDEAWHERFSVEAARIEDCLSAGDTRVEHVGSTAVCGLAAKPIVDILLVVTDPSDEAAYVPPLQEAGYRLRVREPEFFEHRMLRTADRDVHLHVFGPDAAEADRMLAFRNILRTDTSARQRYERVKRRLARREWPTMQHYADAKSDVINDVLREAGGGVEAVHARRAPRAH